MLPADYARNHVRLGYAATEPGDQSDTQDRSITLATGSAAGRGLYVGMTSGRQANQVLVVADTNGLTAAHDLLERVITCDRADVPTVTRREQLVGRASTDRGPPAVARGSRYALSAGADRPESRWTDRPQY